MGRTKTLRPYSVGTLLPGADAYLSETLTLPRDARRWWRYKSAVVCYQAAGGEYVRTRDGFDGAETDDELRAAVDECRQSFGISFPSGWVAPFRANHYSPRLPWTYNAPFADTFRGAWQAALKVGNVPGPLYKYDIRSAYLWALTLGLPDPSGFRATRSLASRPALFRVRLVRPEPSAPYPFNVSDDVNATSDEISYYGLDVREVLAGVAWRRDQSVQKIYDAVTAPTFWKHAARSYWGLWAQGRELACHVASGKTWNLPPITANYVWAHLIVSRVRRRLAEVTNARAAHVFVDSIITPDTLTTGAGVGDWRLDATYQTGLHIRAPGWYGLPEGGALKASGLPLRDARRDAIMAASVGSFSH